MKDHPSISRRGLLRAGLASGVVAASSALPIATVYGAGPANAPADPHAIHQAQQPATQTTPLGGFTYFNTFQAETVNAAAGRLIPTDANGPGAMEAGVVFFIDQQLSASYGLDGRRYEHRPYATGTSTQGDQSGMDMRDRYRLGIQGMEDYAQQLFQKGFAHLSADQQDRILTDMQAGVPNTFDGNSIQAATTMTAASGGEALEQMAPGAPGIGAQAFFNLLLNAGRRLGAGGQLHLSIEEPPEMPGFIGVRLTGVDREGHSQDFAESFAEFLAPRRNWGKEEMGLMLTRGTLDEYGAKVAALPVEGHGVGLIVYLPKRAGGQVIGRQAQR